LALGLQATGARKVAAAPERRAEIEAAIMVTTYRSALGLGLLCLLATPLIAWGLGLDSWAPALMIGLSAVPLTIMGGQSGILQGEKRWGSLGAVYLGVGVGRLVVGGAALALSPTALAAMVGVALAAWIPAIIGALALGHLGRRPARSAVARGENLLREVADNSHALLAFFALSNADVVVARVVFDEHEAGLYAGGLILTKAVLFLPQFVVVVAFPTMASAAGRRSVYLKALALVAGIGLTATLGAWILSDLAVTFIGGSAYESVRPYIAWFALLGTLLAMIQILVYEVVARQHRASVGWLWAGLVAVAGSGVFVATAGSLLVAVLLIDSVVLTALLVSTHLLRIKDEAPAPAQ
jgi:O-antigen/teichoic acid export membrane protein